MLSKPQRTLLCRLYEEQPIALDRLPYTAEFELLCEQFNSNWQSGKTRNEIWCALIDMRKDGVLPTKTRRRKRIEENNQRSLF